VATKAGLLIAETRTERRTGIKEHRRPWRGRTGL